VRYIAQQRPEENDIIAAFARNFRLKCTRTASSNTEDTLSMLMAEHSTYFTAAPHGKMREIFSRAREIFSRARHTRALHL
jgi:hypothetical protein